MKTNTVCSILIALTGAAIYSVCTPAVAEEVTFLANGVVSTVEQFNNAGIEAPPFYPSYVGSSVTVGEPFRIYYTFETTSPGLQSPLDYWHYDNAIKGIRVVIGNDEFSLGLPADTSISIAYNALQPSYEVYYRNQYQFAYGHMYADGGAVYCYFGAFIVTPTPIAGVVFTGLSSDPPDLRPFSVPGYPDPSGQSCNFYDPSGLMGDFIGASPSSLTRVGGPVGSDVDGDSVLDVSDPCPADPSNSCDAGSSGAAVVRAASGGTVTTPDAEVSITAGPGDIASDSTLSVTKTSQSNSSVNLSVGSGPSLGAAIASYDFEPDGMQFDNPVSLLVTTDVTALTPEQRDSIDMYHFADLNGDGISDTFVPLTASCSVVENPLGTFVAHCSVELDHFSKYAVVAPRDTDGDGIFDSFAGQVDACRTQDARGFDADNDGCIDTFSGLSDLVHKLVVEDVISTQMETSLTSKVANAAASATRYDICAAIGQLGSFKAQISGQTGKKISPEAAAKVRKYADSLIAYQQTRLSDGVTCTL